MSSSLTSNLQIKSSSLEQLRSRTDELRSTRSSHPESTKFTRAVFLDKDGTLIEDIPYNVDINRIRLSEGALESLQLLHAANYKIFIITNQSGVARGLFSETALAVVEQHLRRLLAIADIPLAGFYYCPHHPEGIIPPYAIDCHCRKPEPGLLHQAAHDHGIDLHQSWFIGDILNDIEAGRRAGCRTILLDNGNETHWELSYRRMPHHLVSDLVEAAKIITAIDRTPLLRPSPLPVPLLSDLVENS